MLQHRHWRWTGGTFRVWWLVSDTTLVPWRVPCWILSAHSFSLFPCRGPREVLLRGVLIASLPEGNATVSSPPMAGSISHLPAIVPSLSEGKSGSQVPVMQSPLVSLVDRARDFADRFYQEDDELYGKAISGEDAAPTRFSSAPRSGPRSKENSGIEDPVTSSRSFLLILIDLVANGDSNVMKGMKGVIKNGVFIVVIKQIEYLSWGRRRIRVDDFQGGKLCQQ